MKQKRNLYTALSMALTDWSIWNLVPKSKMIAPEGSDDLLLNILCFCEDRAEASQLAVGSANALFHCLQSRNDFKVRELLLRRNLCEEANVCLIEAISVRIENIEFLLTYLSESGVVRSSCSRFGTWIKLIEQKSGPFQWPDSEIHRLMKIVGDTG